MLISINFKDYDVSRKNRIYTIREGKEPCFEKVLSVMCAINDGLEIPKVKLAFFNDHFETHYYFADQYTDGGRHRLLAYMILKENMLAVQENFQKLSNEHTLRAVQIPDYDKILLEDVVLESDMHTYKRAIENGKNNSLPTLENLYNQYGVVLDSLRKFNGFDIDTYLEREYSWIQSRCT